VRADDVVPSWVYPLNPPAVATPTFDSVKPLRLPNSKVSFTQAQLNDLFAAPDWYPDSHGAMPAVVSRGNGPRVFACGYCHSPTGQGRPENASLAGLPADYIIQQVADFKSGVRRSAWHGAYRPSDLMIQVAQNASQEEIEAAARYFASQTLAARVRVIERTQVPVTHVEGWVYVADAGTRREPLAGRILEVAPDVARHEMRDDHLRYVAYVPPGSLARGKLLATTGATGLTGCVSCHGVDLLGAGLAPPIAGRSPGYLLRQLLALQTGARAGAGAGLMKTVVANMTLDDMVAAAAYAASLPPSQSVTVEFELISPKNLRVSYQLPAGCNELPLRSPYSEWQVSELRRSWQAVDACGSQQDGKLVRTGAQCDRVDFNVPTQATAADRVYPPAFPVEGLGIYVHTGIFAPTEACGPVKWRFASRSGDIIYGGRERGASFSMPAGDPDAAYSGIYLSEAAIPAGARSALSPQLPRWISEGLAEATSAVEAGYRRRFPGLSYDPPFVIASSEMTSGSPHQQADVAKGNILRYAYFNPPVEPTPQDINRFRGTIAHEYAHMLEPRALRQLSGESDNLVNEGGAEYLRWSSMIRLGWLSPADAQRELNTALNTCLSIIGERPWQQVRDRGQGDIPYACGLTLHILLLASRSDARSISADAALELYYRRSEAGPVDFGQALECGGFKHCKVRWTPALLSSTVNFASEVDKLIEHAGLSAIRSDLSPKSLQMRSAAITLMNLMDDDCDGSRGFYTRGDGFEISSSPECKTFHDGMKVTRADDLDIAAEPLRAARAWVSQCALSQSAKIGLSDGSSFEIKCGALIPPAAHFYELDIRKVLSRLGLRALAPRQWHSRAQHAAVAQSGFRPSGPDPRPMV
jgi:cytochrome c553